MVFVSVYELLNGLLSWVMLMLVGWVGLVIKAHKNAMTIGNNLIAMIL